RPNAGHGARPSRTPSRGTSAIHASAPASNGGKQRTSRAPLRPARSRTPADCFKTTLLAHRDAVQLPRQIHGRNAELDARWGCTRRVRRGDDLDLVVHHAARARRVVEAERRGGGGEL